MTKELIYLSSPYTHNDPAIMHKRYEAVCAVACTLMQSGYFVFSPIAHCHGPAQYGLPKDFNYWQEYNRLMIDRCDRVMVVELAGWSYSEGVMAEIDYAHNAGKSVTFFSPVESEMITVTIPKKQAIELGLLRV